MGKEVVARLNARARMQKNKGDSSVGAPSNQSEQLLDSGSEPVDSLVGKRKKVVSSSPRRSPRQTENCSYIQSLSSFGSLATTTSVQVGRDLSKVMLFPGDVSEYKQQSLPDRSAQVLAHLSQAFAWASLTDDGAKESHSAIASAQKESEEAESRATTLQQRLKRANEKLKKANESLAKAKRRVKRRDKTVMRESMSANRAEEDMYQAGRLEILSKAKSTDGVDYRLLFPDPEIDLLVNPPVLDPVPQSPEEKSDDHSSCDEHEADRMA